MFVAVIMAGGKGQRFWPLSTTSRPKQFLDLDHCGRTLIQTTFDRVLPLAERPERIFVATAQRYVDLVRSQLPEIPEENLLIEPEARDSAPAVALASLTIAERYPDAVAGFFSSDHRIGRPEAFHASIAQAIDLARNRHGLVTIGIDPTRPATGYGYIEQGEAVEGGHRVARFVEKPNLATARRYLAAGGYAWNAGIFVWEVATVLAELDLHAPELMRPLRAGFDQDRIAEVFPTLEKISIDYALMERTDRCYVVPGDFDWDDIGDWVALERLLKRADDNANTVVGRHVGLDTRSNILYTDNPDDVIVTLGVKDLVVVKRGNAVLLVHKSRVQDIKSLLDDDRLAGIDFEELELS
jgi:mannose-1-phosphate guanylyltransferase